MRQSLMHVWTRVRVRSNNTDMRWLSRGSSCTFRELRPEITFLSDRTSSVNANANIEVAALCFWKLSNLSSRATEANAGHKQNLTVDNSQSRSRPFGQDVASLEPVAISPKLIQSAGGDSDTISWCSADIQGAWTVLDFAHRRKSTQAWAHVSPFGLHYLTPLKRT